jgi:hypothetical protein
MSREIRIEKHREHKSSLAALHQLSHGFLEGTRALVKSDILQYCFQNPKATEKEGLKVPILATPFLLEIFPPCLRPSLSSIAGRWRRSGFA